MGITKKRNAQAENDVKAILVGKVMTEETQPPVESQAKK
jgi:hypothetical protein